MACWICTLGSACSSILALNSAIRYFHALTNGLAIGQLHLRCCVRRVGPDGPGIHLVLALPLNLVGRRRSPHPWCTHATANEATGGMTTLVLASMLAPAAPLPSAAGAERSSLAIRSPAPMSTPDNGTSNPSQIALSSSLEGSFRPPPTSD